MKKYFVILIFIAIGALIYGHTPAGIEFKYTPAKGIIKGVLNIDVKHNISAATNKDPKKHFVKEIIVTLNGKEIQKKIFTKQPNLTDQILNLKIDLKPEDQISVTANCSIKGTKTGEFSLPKTN